MGKGKKGLRAEVAPKSGDVALAGKDGVKAKDLLRTSQAEGQRVMAAVTESAVKRLLKGGLKALSSRSLFDAGETKELADTLASINATADLLARTRVRERQQRAESAQGLLRHGDDQPFEVFADQPIVPLPPEEALAYFRGLVPKLGVDPEIFGPLMRRQAFTLAAATETVLLGKVQMVIRESLATGKNVVPDVQELLDRAGVSVRNPSYSEMVTRTNMMDAYTSAAHAEMQDPEVSETFPVWKYLGIRDGREGDDHRPKFDKYYPNAAAFAEVRGNRPYNCRCVLPGQFAAGSVLLASKARYSGEAVEIVTALGARFSVTKNHPILTVNGFIPAGQLQEGDDLVSHVGENERLVFGDDVQYGPTLIEDVFRSLPEMNTLRVSERWTALDFHGDGGGLQRDVEIKTADLELLRQLNAHGAQHGGERFFGGRHIEQFCLTSGGAADSGGGLLSGRTDAAKFHSCRRQSRGECGPRDAVGIAKRLERFAGRVPIHKAGRWRRAVPTGRPDFDATRDQFFPQRGILDAGDFGKALESFPGFVATGERVKVGNRLRPQRGGDFALTADRRQEGELLSHRVQHDASFFGEGGERFACPVSFGQQFDSRSHRCHGKAIGFGSTANWDVPLAESEREGVVADAQLFRELASRFPGEVSADKVIKVRRFHYSGPVYDLQTTVGYYTIGSDPLAMSVIQNCNSGPIDKWEWADLMAKGAQVETSW